MNLIDDETDDVQVVNDEQDEESTDKATSNVILQKMGPTRRNLIFKYVPKDEKVASELLKDTIDEFFEQHQLGIEEIKDMLVQAVMEDDTWSDLKSIGYVDNGGSEDE